MSSFFRTLFGHPSFSFSFSFYFCRATVAVLLFLAPGAGLSALAECPPLSPNPGGAVAEGLEPLHLDTRLAEMLRSFPVAPGVAVGLVTPQGIYARGFGVRDLETCAPVSPDTMFYLLSVTKSFTGMLAALLQAEGEFELDRSLADYFPELTTPELTMEEPLHPEQITIRDLLLHAPGFFNGGINYRSYLPGNLEQADLLHLLAHYSRPVPRTFRYSNQGYVIAAAAMQESLGQSWRQLLEERLFQPLGMSSTTSSITKATAGDFAWPYLWRLDGGFDRQPVKVEQQMHAAGGVASNVTDLLRWVQIHLNRGKIDGQAFLPAKVVRQAQAPQIQFDLTYDRFHRYAYGLGLHHADYQGDLILHHFGGPIHFSLLPEHGLGVVVLSNETSASAQLTHLLATYLYDLLLGKEGLDAIYAKEIELRKASIDERWRKRAEQESELRAQTTPEAPGRPLEAYVGTYLSDRLGTMEVRVEDNHLRLTYGVLDLALEPHQADAFLAPFLPGDLPERLDFRFGDQANAHTLDWGERLFERHRPHP